MFLEAFIKTFGLRFGDTRSTGLFVPPRHHPAGSLAVRRSRRFVARRRTACTASRLSAHPRHLWGAFSRASTSSRRVDSLLRQRAPGRSSIAALCPDRQVCPPSDCGDPAECKSCNAQEVSRHHQATLPSTPPRCLTARQPRRALIRRPRLVARRRRRPSPPGSACSPPPPATTTTTTTTTVARSFSLPPRTHRPRAATNPLP